MLAIDVAYVENTRAKGVLCIFIFIASDRRVQFSRSIFLTIQINQQLPLSLPPYISSGWYNLLSYDIESNGILQSGYPASIKIIYINEGGMNRG